MEVPEYALQTYNVLNHTNLQDASQVEMHRLDSGISLSRRNDASFIINAYLNFYEHQSTYNPNMPLRSLVYFVGVVKELIGNRDWFSKKLIRIPTPHFVVFYNGTEKRPEVEYLRLSDAFSNPTDTPELELQCVVYNINPGSNDEMLRQCEPLRGYMTFVNKTREYVTEEKPIEQAVEEAVEYCIEHHILEDFFKEKRLEVTRMAIIDMTWEKREPLIRQEEREEGIQLGKIEGRLEGRLEGRVEGGNQMVYKLISSGKLTLEDGATELGISPEQLKNNMLLAGYEI
jgi:hypothetical protein